MKLYAAGFNAWNQLVFAPSPTQEEPADLSSFTAVLDGNDIQLPRASLYQTSVRRNGSVCTAGAAAGRHRVTDGGCPPHETANGEILEAQGQRLVKYASRDAFIAQAISQSWPCRTPVTAIAAFEVGFVVLYDGGTVATLGDARFEACLGRDVSEECPADEPCTVSDLNDLDGPIRHVAADGYTVAALTAGGSLYVWGAATAGTHRRPQAFSTINGVPSFVEVDGDKDVRDVAIGESHAVALMTDDSVYVVGGNDNGQLGLGRRCGKHVKAWTKIDFHPADGFEVVGVAAGPRASFILTSRASSQEVNAAA